MRKQDSDWAELFDQLDIEQYLDSEGITYRRTFGAKGAQLNLKECPSCGGREWKVYINAETGLGNCFHGSCEQRFNKGTFIRSHIGEVGTPASWGAVHSQVEIFLKANGWMPKRKVVLNKPKASSDEVQIPASLSLPIDGRNLKYLTQRGIGLEITRHYGLRFSASGVYRYEFDGKSITQDYANRVLIPIRDLEGVLVNFQGRDITGVSPTRYLFPPGLAGTGRFLFNGHEVRGRRSIAIGEGPFDVFSLDAALADDKHTKQVGVIGTFGKHISGVIDPDADFRLPDEQCQVTELMKLKAEGLEEVVFLWDGERGARSAAVRAGLFLKRLGIACRLGLLPEGKDPNECSAADIRKAYWQAEVITPLNVARWRARKLI